MSRVSRSPGRASVRGPGAGFALVLVLLITSLTIPPVPTAQAQGAFDLSAALAAGNPLYLDESRNDILGTVHNGGSLPSRIKITWTISNPGHPDAVKEGPTNVAEPLNAGADRQFEFLWDGTYHDVVTGEDRPLYGPLTITFRVDAQDSFQTEAQSTLGNNLATAQSDLRYFGFSTTSSPPGAGEKIDVGQEWTHFVGVTNVGNGPDDAKLSIGTSSPGWAFDFVDDQRQLHFDQTGSQRGFIVMAIAPVTAGAGTQGTATVLLSSVGSNEVRQDTVVITTPPVSESGSLAISLSPTSRTIAPGNSATTTVTVTNLQNHADDLVLEVPFLTGDAGLVPVVDPDDAVSVGSGATAAFSVTIPAPSTAPAGPSSWRVRALSSEDATKKAETVFSVTVTQLFGMGMELVSAPSSAEPGKAFNVNVKLKNLGNGQDTLRVDLSQGPSGWSSAGAQAPLGRGQETTVPVPVTVPAQSPPGQRTLVFRARSLGDPTKFAEISLPVSLAAKAIPVVSVEVANRAIERDQTIAFSILIKNNGNKADTFELSGVVNDSFTQPTGWDANLQPASVDVAPGAETVATLEVTAPSALTPEMNGLEIDVVAEATDGTKHNATIRAGPAFPNLKAELVGADPAPVYLGQHAQIVGRVSNIGNAPTAGGFDATMVIKETGQTAVLKTVTFEIPALESHGTGSSFVVRTSLPTSKASISITFTVDPGHDVSQHDLSNDVATQTMVLRNLDISIAVPQDAIVTPGVALSYEGNGGFRASNVGTNTSAITLNITSTANWVTATLAVQALAPDQSVTIPVNFVVPAAPTVEECTITITASLTADNAVKVTKSMRLRAPDDAPPSITSVKAEPNSLHVGDKTLISALVNDALGVANVKLSLVNPAGIVTSLAMTSQGNGHYSAEPTFTNAGVHLAFVSAEDRSSAKNSASTQTRPVLVTVNATASSTQLQLAAPDEGSAFRPGTPILVTVQSATTPQAAEFEVAGVRTPVSPISPLQIPTEGWPDGPVEVLVKVRDGAGATVSQTYSFVVDGSPPTISGLGLGNPKPAAGERLTVSASLTDLSGIRNATLRIDRAGEPALEVPLLLAEGDQYAAMVTWEEGFRTVAVLAQDAVGNRAYLDLSAGTLAGLKPEPRDTPAPGALLFLFVVGAAAAARGRRVGGGPS